MLADAVFLEDGRVVLQVVMPAGERQAWTLDPDGHLASARLGTASAQSPIAVRPDGQAVATLQPRTRDPETVRSPLAFVDHIPTAEVWLYPTAPETPPQRAWVDGDPAEELVDLAWAPDDRHLRLDISRPTVGLSISEVSRGKASLRSSGVDGSHALRRRCELRACRRRGCPPCPRAPGECRRNGRRWSGQALSCPRRSCRGGSEECRPADRRSRHRRP